MSEPIDQRWLIRQWVITELSTGADPSPSCRLISSHWLQYYSDDWEETEAPYKPDKQAAAIVERVWATQPQLTRIILRPYYFERQLRAGQQQYNLSALFESKAWDKYERERDTENFGLNDSTVRASPGSVVPHV